MSLGIKLQKKLELNLIYFLMFSLLAWSSRDSSISTTHLHTKVVDAVDDEFMQSTFVSTHKSYHFRNQDHHP